jgi:hypothetical protein
MQVQLNMWVAEYYTDVSAGTLTTMAHLAAWLVGVVASSAVMHGKADTSAIFGKQPGWTIKSEVLFYLMRQEQQQETRDVVLLTTIQPLPVDVTCMLAGNPSAR